MVHNTRKYWVFWTLTIVQNFKKTLKNATFRKLYLELRKETDSVSETLFSLVFLGYRTMDKVKKNILRFDSS
jgi:hypothetical protein